jgi:xanthine/uracil permease
VNFPQFLSKFFHDGKVEAALLAILLDFVAGVAAAIRVGNFRFSYVADFARNDVLLKLIPYFFFYAAALVAGDQDLVIPGLDLGFVAGAIYAAIMAAWIGSILGSLARLFPGIVTVPGPTPAADVAGAPRERGVAPARTGRSRIMTALFAPENDAPPKD